MMRTLLLSFLVFQFLFCSAQNATKPEPKKTHIAHLVKPEFPGGMNKMYQYISDNTKYPQRASTQEESGNVYVRFVVQKNGEISNVEILKGIGFGMDEEAKRVIKTMPRWKPARYKGKAIPYVYELPIEFIIVQ